jgi:hypothetical protein
MPALTDSTSCCPRVCPRGGPPHCAACYKGKGEPRVLPVPLQFRSVCLWRFDEHLLT